MPNVERKKFKATSWRYLSLFLASQYAKNVGPMCAAIIKFCSGFYVLAYILEAGGKAQTLYAQCVILLHSHMREPLELLV